MASGGGSGESVKPRGFGSIIVAFATLIMAACAGGVPPGWERDDYLAYLVISDFLRLRDIHGEPSEPFVACIVNGIGRPSADYEDLPDPSPQLLNALISDFSSGTDKRTIRPGSACHEVSARGVEERATGRPAIYVSVDTNEDDCGTHLVNSHHAALWGQGAFYRVDLNIVPAKAIRHEFCFVAE
jgi:hypothetical protein